MFNKIKVSIHIPLGNRAAVFGVNNRQVTSNNNKLYGNSLNKCRKYAVISLDRLIRLDSVSN